MDREDPAIVERARVSGPPWAFFACGERGFALRLDRVHEIVPPQPVTRVPGCGREVYGLVGLRGRVITVFDYGVIAGGTAAADLPGHRLVLVRHGDRVVGLAVDRMLTISSPEDIETGSGPAGPGASTDADTGSLDVGGRIFTILDPDRVFGSLLA